MPTRSLLASAGQVYLEPPASTPAEEKKILTAEALRLLASHAEVCVACSGQQAPFSWVGSPLRRCFEQKIEAREALGLLSLTTKARRAAFPSQHGIA